MSLTAEERAELELGIDYSRRITAIEPAGTGAWMLDRWNSEWFRKIDLKKLNESDADMGILSQFFSSHQEAVAALKITLITAPKAGFMCPDDTHPCMLIAAWKFEVWRRLNPDFKVLIHPQKA